MSQALSDLDSEEDFWQVLGSPFASSERQPASGFPAWYAWLVVVFRSRGVERLQDRQDLATETLTRVWEKRGAIQDGQGRAVVLATVTTVLRDYPGSPHRDRNTVPLDHDVADPQTTRDEPLPDRVQAIKAVLKRKLSKEELKLLIDCEVKELSYEQMSRKWGRSAETLRQQKCRLLKRLRAVPELKEMVKP